MRELLLRLADMDKTLIVTSHILPELSRICDEVAIISAGKIRALGTLDEITEQLGQMRMVEIELRDASDVSKAVSVLEENVPGVESTSSESEKLIRFRANLTEEAMQQLLASLVNGSVSVSQFHEVQTDLEDAFLTVTKEDRAKMV